MVRLLSSKRTGSFEDIQVDPGNGVLPAGSDRVGAGGWHLESQRLYGVNIVSVITDNSRQGGLPHLNTTTLRLRLQLSLFIFTSLSWVREKAMFSSTPRS